MALNDRLGRRVIAPLALSAAFIGLSACSGSEQRPPAPEPNVAATTSVPSASPTAAFTVPAVPSEALRLSNDLPPEQLVLATLQLRSDWFTAGATDATAQTTYDAWRNYFNGGIEDFKSELARQNAEYYAAALLPDEWRGDSYATAIYDDMVARNMQFIESAIARVSDGMPMIGYQFTVDSVVQNEFTSDEIRLIEFDLHETFLNNPTLPEQDSHAIYRYKIEDDGTARLLEILYT
ncbi:hypothetical protein [Cellulomonas endometrii]|uniref:hypothetical protein n=1 Tax=Cellulomonas endometrii TaxID=3036301 RepID=UPI0024AD4390|nr:hypothetical protein [Cellulomonas endometrii]